jgi:hypothetical protein
LFFIGVGTKKEMLLENFGSSETTVQKKDEESILSDVNNKLPDWIRQTFKAEHIQKFAENDLHIEDWKRIGSYINRL